LWHEINLTVARNKNFKLKFLKSIKLSLSCVIQTDLEDQANELRSAEDQAKKAMADAARLADELRQEQDHSAQIEKMRRTLELQVPSSYMSFCSFFCKLPTKPAANRNSI